MVRTSGSALFLLVASAAAVCPLQLPPEQACEVSSPICALFTDADGDGLCDNPGPQTVPDTAIVVPDTVQVIDPNPPDSVEVVEPDTAAVVEPDTTGNGQDTRPDTIVVPQDTMTVTEDTVSVAPPDTVSLPPDTTTAVPDTAAVALLDTTSTPPPWQPAPNGCPRYLPPAAACPYDRQLCPHWYGRLPTGACLNPSEGLQRAALSLAAIAVLLVPATVLSRSIRGRRNRKKAKLIRTISLVSSLIFLGFWLQGCYCPIGMWQYLFLKTFGFLAWTGFALLMLPIVHAMFFGRIFCGWVCPIGALQEMLGRIPIPGAPKVPRRLDRILVALKYVVAVLFTASVFAAGRGLFGMVWPALFCEIDPFHTIFSTFLTGSLTLAVAAIVLSMFFGRFYCRYLCFYGAVLSIACRFGLWSRIRSSTTGGRSCEPAGTTTPTCEIDQGEE